MFINDTGNLLKDMGRLSEASLPYERALTLKPDDHLAMNNLGVVRFLETIRTATRGFINHIALAVQSGISGYPYTFGYGPTA